MATGLLSWKHDCCYRDGTYFDPGEEHSNSDHVVKLGLPETKVVKVSILVGVIEERGEKVLDHN